MELAKRIKRDVSDWFLVVRSRHSKKQNIMHVYRWMFSLLLIVSAGCVPQDFSEGNEKNVAPVSMAVSEGLIPFSLADEFGDYWYQGEAELSSYTLSQARYGELHEGEAVMIFVTEDFSKSKQVKMDYPAKAPADKVGVLKLNMTKTFNTGLYPYSMMTSSFTPIQRLEHPHTLKITTSSQEWCGHTFTQLNLKKNKYALQFNSYFESEGDQSLTLDDVLLEDEVWALIRLDPEALPTGELKMIPGTMYQRLSHNDWGVVNAEASLQPSGEDDLMHYTITYPDYKRTLTIQFEKAFPHEIEGWEDTYQSGWGADAPMLTTRATKKKRIMLDYWNRNRNQDTPLRQELDLD